MNIPEKDAIYIYGKKVCDIRWVKEQTKEYSSCQKKETIHTNILPEIVYTREWMKNGFPLGCYFHFEKQIYEAEANNQPYHFVQDMLPFGYRPGMYKQFNNADYEKFGRFGLVLAIPPVIRQGAIEFASDKLREYEYTVPSISEFYDFLQKWEKGESISDYRFKNIIDYQYSPRIYVQHKNNIYLIKFSYPSDDMDSSLLEKIASDMAKDCGIDVPETQLARIPGNLHAIFTRRFDRDRQGRKIHYSSAANLCGSRWGFTDSYLDMAVFIKRQGNVLDLPKLWKYCLFNVMVSNIDDHLYNFGFLRIGNEWRLAPDFDINIIRDAENAGHNLMFDHEGHQNPSSWDVVQLAGEYAVGKEEAETIYEKMKNVVGRWERYADRYGADNKVKDYMNLSLCEKAESDDSCPVFLP